jgi:glycosyltransferase involved in cell wall biosynthesis
VLIATHNPHAGRLRAVLDALTAQKLATQQFEVLLIDNASDQVQVHSLIGDITLPLTLLREPQLGLSHARRCGMRAAAGELLVLVDDDNVLDEDFLQQALQLALAHPQIGCFGGRVQPRFEHPPLPWQTEFFPLLALVDHGSETLIFSAADFAQQGVYPPIAPVGAGMVLRRSAALAWLETDAARPQQLRLSDRRGNTAASSGDNDIVLCTLARGFDVAYFQQLGLTHLIPASRLQRTALGRLNQGIQCSWQRLLTLHGINPWSPLSTLSARLRCWRAWLSYQAWRSDPHWVRWMGARGHFEGRVPAIQEQA